MTHRVIHRVARPASQGRGGSPVDNPSSQGSTYPNRIPVQTTGATSLKSSGEEFDCAQAIDSLPAVKHWIRNLAGPGRQDTSFWLPTSTDRFYPDFVAELTDGRTLVVEYKGEAYATNDDSKEKRNIGELWEEKSGKRGLFLLAEKSDSKGRNVRAQLEAKIGN